MANEAKGHRKSMNALLQARPITGRMTDIAVKAPLVQAIQDGDYPIWIMSVFTFNQNGAMTQTEIHDIKSLTHVGTAAAQKRRAIDGTTSA